MISLIKSIWLYIVKAVRANGLNEQINDIIRNYYYM